MLHNFFNARLQYQVDCFDNDQVGNTDCGEALMTAKIFPHTRRASLGKADLSKERAWILEHGHEYAGQWVVLHEDSLLGHTSDNDEVAAMVDKARAEGVRVPYVKYISIAPCDMV